MSTVVQTASERGSYAAEVDLLARIGPRLTGAQAQEQLIDHVHRSLAKLGLEVHTDTHVFARWEGAADSAGLALFVGSERVDIAAAFPYSGVTGADGVRGRLRRLRGPLPFWPAATRGVAVVQIRNRPFPMSAFVGTWGDEAWGRMTNPLLPATIAGLSLGHARRAGVKGVVFAWDRVSAANARSQYLPFVFDYQRIPAVFVAGDAATKVLAAAGRGETARLVLDASLTPNASTRTIWATVEGCRRPDETILVVTHSDGTNVVEENGHIGLLALARDVSAHTPDRTVVFVLVTGHLRMRAVTRHGQALTRWLRDHPELWAGGPGQRRAVAGLAIEHLGAREFRDDPTTGSFAPTGRAEPELLYASTRELTALLHREWRGAEPGPTRVSKPTPLFHFGEGQPMYQRRIPTVALVTAPQYLLSETPGHYVDIDLMHRQVDSFRRLLGRLDTTPTTDIGTVPANTLPRKAAALIGSSARFLWSMRAR